jgi:hypothetical protein
MEPIVQEATQAILPFLGAGAGAAAQGFAERAGASMSDGTLRVIERIRQRLAGRAASRPSVAEVLQEALGASDVTEQELQSLVVEVGRVQISQGAQISQQAEKIYNGDITAEVFNG